MEDGALGCNLGGEWKGGQQCDSMPYRLYPPYSCIRKIFAMGEICSRLQLFEDVVYAFSTNNEGSGRVERHSDSL